MFYELLHRSVDLSGLCSPFSPSYIRLTSKVVESKGVLCRKSCFEVFSTADTLSHISVNDFKLDNILMQGAYDLLKPCYAPDTNNLNVVQGVSNVLKESFNELSKKNSPEV